MKPDFETIRDNAEIRTYITQADASLLALGYTEHSFPHVMRCAHAAADLLTRLGYDQRQVELARVAGYMHDIGNVVNRVDHAQSGAVMAFRILDKMGMAPEDVAVVVTAIGNHDEGTACPVNAVAAALILADKTDVRRSRVRSKATIGSDIHDRVNYAVVESSTTLNQQEKTFTLSITRDTAICPILEYFEIFMERMLLCRRAADFFGLQFGVVINGQKLM